MAKQDLQQHEEQDQKKISEVAPALRPQPWLVCLHGKKDKRSQTFYSLLEHQYHVENMPEIRAHKICTSAHGWFVLKPPNGKDCFLLNPVTMEKIQLPDWPDDSDFFACLLSSPPPNIDDPNADSSCVVMFTLSAEEETILYCKPGDDHWTKEEVKKQCTCHRPLMLLFLASFNCEVYAIADCCETLFKIEVNLAGDDDVSLGRGYYLTLLDLNVRRPDTLVHKTRCYTDVCGMVQYSPTDLMIIEGHYGDILVQEDDVKEIGVKGIELYNVNIHKRVWEKVEALPEDCAIFLGFDTQTGIYKIPREYLGMGHFRGNTIYFTQQRDMYLYAYDVQERSITVSSPYPYVRRDYYQPEWILTPGWSSMSADPQPEEPSASEDDSRNQIVLSDNSVGDGWCDIPIDLLQDIQSRLLGADRCCFRLACKTWESAFSSSTSEPYDQFAEHLFPVLMHIGQHCQQANFFNPITNSTSILPLPGLNLVDTFLLCSKHGWLLMSSQGRSSTLLFFFNPFTKQRIDLPNKDMYAFHFQGITFSSPPTSSDCIVLAYCISPECLELIFIHRGEHRWTYSEIAMDGGTPFEQSFNNPVYHQGLIYIMGKYGNLFICELSKERRLTQIAKLLHLPSNPCKSIRGSPLLECNGKLLSVFTGHIGSFLQVYELNQEIMAWKELDSLEDTMLFLSSASSLSATSNGMDISGLGNKVFLDRFNGKDGVFYSLATRRFHTFWSGYNCDDWCDTKGYTNCAWVEPNFERHTEAELRWFDPAALQNVEDLEE